MYATHLTFHIWKTFCQKKYNVLIFLIVSAKSMEVLIELSEDCYCNPSVQIPNEQTSGKSNTERRVEVFTTLYNVCSVHQGMSSTLGGVQYIGGIP